MQNTNKPQIVFYRNDDKNLTPQEVEYTRGQLAEVNRMIDKLCKRRHLLNMRLEGGQIVHRGTVAEIDIGSPDDAHVYPVKIVSDNGTIQYIRKEQIVKHKPLI